jgi:hypothetical protein
MRAISWGPPSYEETDVDSYVDPDVIIKGIIRKRVKDKQCTFFGRTESICGGMVTVQEEPAVSGSNC